MSSSSNSETTKRASGGIGEARSGETQPTREPHRAVLAAKRETVAVGRVAAADPAVDANADRCGELELAAFEERDPAGLLGVAPGPPRPAVDAGVAAGVEPEREERRAGVAPGSRGQAAAGELGGGQLPAGKLELGTSPFGRHVAWIDGPSELLRGGWLDDELPRAREQARHARRVELGARGVSACEPGADALSRTGRRQRDEGQGGGNRPGYPGAPLPGSLAEDAAPAAAAAAFHRVLALCG